MTNNEATLVGGGLAIAGGVVAAIIQARLQRRYERERHEKEAMEEAARAKHDLIAAIRIVRHELTTTATCIELRTFLSEFSDSNYRSVQLLLARRLPDALRTHLAVLYAIDLPIAASKMRALLELQRSAPSMPAPTLRASQESAYKGLPEIATKMHDVNQQLLDYLRSELGAEP